MFSWGELFSTFLVRKIMGMKGTCRSANGGGVPFYMLPFSISKHPFCPPSFHSLRHQFSTKETQKWQKLYFIWCGLVFSREFGRQETAKFKIYLIFEGCRASVVALSLGRWWCPLVAGGRGTLAILLTLAKMDKIPSFRPFAALLLVHCLQIWLYFAF